MPFNVQDLMDDLGAMIGKFAISTSNHPNHQAENDAAIHTLVMTIYTLGVLTARPANADQAKIDAAFAGLESNKAKLAELLSTADLPPAAESSAT